MSDPDHHAEMEEHVSYGKRIQELGAEIERLERDLRLSDSELVARGIEIERLREKVRHLTNLLDDQYGTPCEQIRHAEQTTEAAAFLVGLAERLEKCQGIITGDPECPCQENAADCRAMARKLRGET